MRRPSLASALPTVVAVVLVGLMLVGLAQGSVRSPSVAGIAVGSGPGLRPPGGSHSAPWLSETRAIRSTVLPACSSLANPPDPETPAVLAAEQFPCARGADAAILNFYNASGSSAERFRINLTLPLGTDTGRILQSFFVGLWVGGVPCSYGSKSFLEVALVPPFSAPGPNPPANWSVRVPVFDLAPVASCDGPCQNDSASLTIQGRLYCEDQVGLLPSQRAPVAPRGGFAPGDALSVDVVGVAGGGSGLGVYVNDSSRPGRALAVSLGPGSSSLGRPITPFFAGARNGSTGWGYGGPVSVGWNDCPSATGPSACNSYDAALLGAIGSPSVTGAAFWDPVRSQYSDPYAWVTATSTSLGCGRASGTGASCQNVHQFGGSGAYPNWTVVPSHGAVGWQPTPAVPGGLNPFAVNGTEYGPDNVTGAVAAVGLALPVDTSPSTVYLNVSTRAAAPDGVAAVSLSVLGCTGSSSPVVSTVSATRGPGPDNTSESANWTTSTQFPGYPGTYPYWVRAESSSGLWSLPRYGNASVAGALSACGFGTVAAPVYTAANVTAVAGGYSVNWTDPAPGVASHTVYLNATTGGTHFRFVTGPGRSAVVRSGVGGGVYDVAVSATTIAGASSAVGGTVVGPTTLAPIGVSVASSPVQLVAPTVSSTVTATVVGGEPPYNVSLDFGDGSTLDLLNSGPLASTSHTFPLDVGLARLTATVVDARGDVAASVPVLVLLQATPLGVSASVGAGDGFVDLSWTPPVSPGGSVRTYAVFYVEGATAGPLDLSSSWPNNGSGPSATHIWNTTRTTLLIPANNGVLLSARVIAFNPNGAGGLANGTEYLSAIPAPLAVGPIVAGPGGRAPYLDSFSTVVTTGTNNSIGQAIYSFTGGNFVNAGVAGANGTFFINATATFTIPGLIVVTLHVVDAFNDVAIATTDIVVVAGAGPAVSVSLATGATVGVFVGSAVNFVSTVTGGSGNYSYFWEFGDGTQANASNPSHVYANPGNFTVRLNVIDNVTGGGTLWTGTITILGVPTVAITGTAGPNGSFSFRFTAFYYGGSGFTTFAWAFSDGATSGGTHVNHDFPGPGRYVVNLTAVDVPSGRAANASVVLVLGSTGSGSGGASITPYVVTIGVLAGLAAFGLIAWVVERGKGPPPPLTAEEEAATRDPFPVGASRPALPPPSGGEVVPAEGPRGG
ncbi:MAG: PKD domain-containing protein [Thermoplasmata archaeon]|nr:PKD domain-containing protein [Thermoplasmata archaeon]